MLFRSLASVCDLSVASVEALLRWRHPERGTLAPGAFLDAVDGSRLAWELDIHVLELAIEQGARWVSHDLRLPIAVNVSAASLVDSRLPAQLARLLARHDLDPGLIELEATEGAVIAEPIAAAAVLQRISDEGVGSIAIDDFGTGYSSLARLHELPLDKLKIDRSFVARMTDYRDTGSVAAIVALAHNLGMTVVAEGIETAAAREMLEGLGCEEFQGLWLARPMPPQELERWLDGRQLGHAPRRPSDEATVVRDRQRVQMRDRYFGAALVEALGAVVIHNDQREYVECNRAACELLGVSREQLLHSRIDDFTPPQQRPELARVWSAFLRTGSSCGTWTYELPDGRRRELWVERSANFVRGHHVSILRPAGERRTPDPAAARRRERAPAAPVRS